MPPADAESGEPDEGDREQYLDVRALELLRAKQDPPSGWGGQLGAGGGALAAGLPQKPLLAAAAEVAEAAPV